LRDGPVTTPEPNKSLVSMNIPGRPVPIDAVAAIRDTLEAAGVEFTNGDEPGVKLRKADP